MTIERKKLQEQTVKTTMPEITNLAERADSFQVRCWLCDAPDAWVYRGLATLGIEYQGETRFICDTCVDKIKRA